MKDRIIFLTTDPNESDNVGAYVRAGTDGTQIGSTTVGPKDGLNVYVINPTSGEGLYAEDSGHVTGDVGSFSLGVRQDALVTSVNADGDYAALKVNDRGGLWSVPVGTVADDAVDTENPVKIGTRALSGPLTAVSSGDRADAISDIYRRLYTTDASNNAVICAAQAIANVEAQIAPSPLAGRRKLLIQNLALAQDIYIGATGVTTSTGFQIRRGSTWEFSLGQNVSFYAVAPTAVAADTRVLQIA